MLLGVPQKERFVRACSMLHFLHLEGTGSALIAPILCQYMNEKICSIYLNFVKTATFHFLSDPQYSNDMIPHAMHKVCLAAPTWRPPYGGRDVVLRPQAVRHGDPKVGHLGLHGGVQEDVARFDVPVDDGGVRPLVQVSQAPRGAQRSLQPLAPAEGGAPVIVCERGGGRRSDLRSLIWKDQIHGLQSGEVKFTVFNLERSISRSPIWRDRIHGLQSGKIVAASGAAPSCGLQLRGGGAAVSPFAKEGEGA
jgi:hypothetical protein